MRIICVMDDRDKRSKPSVSSRQRELRGLRSLRNNDSVANLKHEGFVLSHPYQRKYSVSSMIHDFQLVILKHYIICSEHFGSRDIRQSFFTAIVEEKAMKSVLSPFEICSYIKSICIYINTPIKYPISYFC